MVKEYETFNVYKKPVISTFIRSFCKIEHGTIVKFTEQVNKGEPIKDNKNTLYGI
jgi:hypothetical protein